MSAKDAGMRAKDATMSAKDATMSATDANINAEKATMTAKNATTSAKAAIKVYHRSPYPRLSRMSVVMPEGVADFGRHARSLHGFRSPCPSQSRISIAMAASGTSKANAIDK